MDASLHEHRALRVVPGRTITRAAGNWHMESDGSSGGGDHLADSQTRVTVLAWFVPVHRAHNGARSIGDAYRDIAARRSA